MGVGLEVYLFPLYGGCPAGVTPALMTLSSQPKLQGLSRSELPLRYVPPSSPLSSLPSSPLQVKIFEEDFQRERSDRERMNEEKEELKKQVEKLQAQVTLSNAQVRRAGPRKGPWACPHGDGGMDCRVPVSLDVRTLTASSSTAISSCEFPGDMPPHP